MDKIYYCEPIDKKANILTSQARCSDGTLTVEQQIENIKTKMDAITRTRNKETDPIKRKRLGREIFELSQDIHRIRPFKKLKLDVSDYFIAEVKGYLTKPIYKMLMDKAKEKAKRNKTIIEA